MQFDSLLARLRNSFKVQLIMIFVAICAVLLFGDTYIIHITIICMTYGVVVSNWNIAVGYTGVFHLAQVPFFILGGYTSGILTAKLGFSPWIGLIAAGVAALGLSLAIGIISLRVKGIYLLYLSLAIQLVMLSFVLYFVEWTNGDLGLRLPPLEIYGLKINQFNLVPAYFFALALMISSLILIRKVVHSNLGLALMSLRDSEVYSASRGVSSYKTRLVAFVLSSWPTGICGAFYYHYLGTIGPGDLGWNLVTIFLASMVIGGLGTLYGPFLGSFLLVFMNEYFRFLSLYRPIIYSGLMVITLIFLPKGLTSIVTRVRDVWASVSISRERSRQTT